VLLVADHLRVETLLVEVPDAVVSLVEPLGVDAVEAVHAERDVLERPLDDEVKVVREQAVDVEPPVKAGRCLAQKPSPTPPVDVVDDDGHSRNATNREVIPTGGRKNAARLSSHGPDRRAVAKALGRGRLPFYRHVTGTVHKTRTVWTVLFRRSLRTR
jgi:hypothetical protein